MRIYIAGKITGLRNYKENFRSAERKLSMHGHICMNPSILPEGFPWESYMPICFAMIDACDAVYLLENWIDSKGAKLEYEYAKSKRKKIFYDNAGKDKERDIIALYKSGYSLKRLGCISSLGDRRVRQILVNNGIPIRGKKESIKAYKIQAEKELEIENRL